MDLRWPRVYRRSNLGLVIYVIALANGYHSTRSASFSAQVWEVFFKVAFIDEEAHIFVMRPQPLSHIDGPKPISNGQ